jgi:hypothetical protein
MNGFLLAAYVQYVMNMVGGTAQSLQAESANTNNQMDDTIQIIASFVTYQTKESNKYEN